jgi:hypothetical protein
VPACSKNFQNCEVLSVEPNAQPHAQMTTVELSVCFTFYSSVGELSPDLKYVGQVVQSCSFMFFLVTSVAGATAARERFIEKNKSTKFNTRFMALVCSYFTHQ